MTLGRALASMTALATLTACRIAGAGTGADHAAVALDATLQGQPTAVEQAHKIDVQELSGLVTVPLADGEAAQVLGVGDRTRELVRLRFPTWDAANPEVEKVDLRALFPAGDSQWEGVATDGAGRVFIMQESPSLIFVVEPEVPQIVQTITLDVAAFSAAGGDDNSLGEALALLRHGHVIWVKEKDPPLLVEFGPAGDNPLGVVPESLLGAEPFALSDGPAAQYVPLKIWDFGGPTQALLADFSDLATGPDGFVYVLSDASRRIGRLEGRITPGEAKAKIKAYWDLPPAIEKPEGLAFIGEHPVVGSDRIGGKNVFVLKKLHE